MKWTSLGFSVCAVYKSHVLPGSATLPPCLTTSFYSLENLYEDVQVLLNEALGYRLRTIRYPSVWAPSIYPSNR